MKNTGIVRKVDELGRVVIPKELRTNLGLVEGTPMEIFTDGESVVLKRHRKACVVTGEISDTNLELFGVVLSRKGAKVLMDEILEKGEEKGWI